MTYFFYDWITLLELYWLLQSSFCWTQTFLVAFDRSVRAGAVRHLWFKCSLQVSSSLQHGNAKAAVRFKVAVGQNPGTGQKVVIPKKVPEVGLV